MNITTEMQSPPPTGSADAMDSAYNSLSEADRGAVLHMNAIILRALLSGKGTAVLMADEAGDGTATIIAVGVASQVPTLLYAAGAAGDELFGRSEGVLLQ